MVNIANSVEVGARQWPDRPALLFQGQTWTYQNLDHRSQLLAASFQRQGLGRGDRIALLLPNSPHFVECYLAILKLGAIAVSLNPGLAPGEWTFLLGDCSAKALVTSAALAPAVPREKLPKLQHLWVIEEEADDSPTLTQLVLESFPDSLGGSLGTSPVAMPDASFESAVMSRDDPAAIVYTSGTTGQPKGATLSHGNILANMAAKQRYLGMGPDDRLLLFLPLFHCFGQNAVLNSGLGAGATLVLHTGFEVQQILRSIARDSVTMFFGIPTSFLLLEQSASREALADIRYFFSAATSLPKTLESRWRKKFGKVIHQGYGLTETSPFASYNHEKQHREGSVGSPIDGVEMKVVDPETGLDLGTDEVGEIAIRGHNVMLGYWQRPGETAAAIRNGWFFTGDIGRRDESGYYYIEDRLKDMVSVGGLKVYPAEVENVLHQHPAVADVAVFGAPEPLLGERVAARVVLQSGMKISPSDLEDFCRQHLAPFKVPTEIEWASELPRSPSGKLLKRSLRQQARESTEEAQARPLGPESPTKPGALAIVEWLVSWLGSALGETPEQLSHRSTFFDLGLGSAQAVKLAAELSRFTGHRVEPASLWTHSTIETLSQFASGISAPVQHREPKPPEPAESDLSALSDEELAELLRAEILGTPRTQE